MNLQRSFGPRVKLWAHLAQLVLIIIAIALTGAHMNLGVIYSRAEIMTIAMGAKSIVVVSYQLLSQHVSRFRRWESALANLILNLLEVLFWIVVVSLKLRSVQRFCQGTACSLSVGVIVIVFILLVFCIHVAVTSVLDYRYFKEDKTTRGSAPSTYALERSGK